MKLLKTDQKKLLEEALESLHQQSTAWLRQLELWKDEQLFYHDLISNRLFQTSLSDQQSIARILNKAEGEEIDALYKEILSHEKFLRSIMDSSDHEDRYYRDAHKQLLTRYNKLDDTARVMKKAMLSLMKLVNENFFNRNETLATIAERRAVRKYTTRTVERVLIGQILKAACMAPSAVNGQPWKFYVLNNRERIKNYDGEVFKAADKLYHELMTHMPKENPIFHGAPVVIFITAPKANEWASLDIGLCAQNLMLAAKSIGMDTCPVGLARFIENTSVYPELRIPAHEEILLAVTLGYGDEKPEMHERKKNNVIFLT